MMCFTVVGGVSCVPLALQIVPAGKTWPVLPLLPVELVLDALLPVEPVLVELAPVPVEPAPADAPPVEPAAVVEVVDPVALDDELADALLADDEVVELVEPFVVVLAVELEEAPVAEAASLPDVEPPAVAAELLELPEDVGELEPQAISTALSATTIP